MTRKLPVYLGVLAGVLLATGALFGWLAATGHGSAAGAVLLVGNLLVTAWLCWGLWVWRYVPWVGWVTRVLVLTLFAQLTANAAFALDLPGFGRLVIGAWAMGAAFYVGLSLLRLAFVAGHPILGVARTMLDEAIRQKVGLIFVVILVILVPMLPLILADSRLEYRVSNFLRYSLFVTGLLLSIMTILLCARSVSREVESKIAFVTLTKPVARWQYLVGKWVGVMGLNAVLLAVAGVGVYTLTLTVAQQPAQDPLDAAAVKDQVLTARVVLKPDEVDAGQLRREVDAKLERLRQLAPDEYMAQDPLTGERRPIPFEDLPEKLATPLQAEVVSEWLRIGARGSKVYRFSGLDDAESYGPFVQLRLKPKAIGAAPPDKKLQLWFRANGRELPFVAEINGQVREMQMPRIAEDKFAIVRIPTDTISEEGTIDLEVFNGGRGAPAQPDIRFSPVDGMEMLYTTGTFGPNLIKALVVIWVRLMFLAMLGLAAATFLGFPTACLLSGLVFFAAAFSGYLDESLGQYGAFPDDELPWWQQLLGAPAAFIAKLAEGEWYDAFKVVIRTIGEVFRLFVPSLGEYNPVPLVAEGKAVTLDLIGGALLWVGGVWTGALALIGITLFHRRELAQVTV